MTVETTLTRPRRHSPRKTGLLGWLVLAREARRQRRALAKLPPERLDDIGLTPDTARKEANLPAWNVPQHWLR